MVLDGMMSFCADYRIIQDANVKTLRKIARQELLKAMTAVPFMHPKTRSPSFPLKIPTEMRPSAFRSKISEI
jgi:hypothetical protein